MPSSPKVSIVIPVYNGANFLNEAIDSALAQTYNNIEILVINDGSNDDGKTEAIAKSYGEKIKYFYKENGGVASALNLGIKKMTGEYFSWLSHDDLYYPDKIRKSIEIINNQSETVIVYSDYEIIDKDGAILEKILLPCIEKKKFRISLIVNRSIHGCSLLIPKICFNKIAYFNEKLRTVQDYDLWLKLAEKYNFIHISKILIKSRHHPEQDSKKNFNTHKDEKEKLFINWIKEITNTELINYTTYKSIHFTYLLMGIEILSKNNFITANYLLKRSLNNFNNYNLKLSTIYSGKLFLFAISYITKLPILIKKIILSSFIK